MSPRWRKIVVTRGLPGLLGIYLLLLIPDCGPGAPTPAAKSPFAWDMDARWRQLEASFVEARGAEAGALRTQVRASIEEASTRVADLRARTVGPDDPAWQEIEDALFVLAPKVAACPGELPSLLELAGALREMVKRQSARWDMGSPQARARLYRLLYGGRAAVEEAMLQAPPGSLPTDLVCRDEPSRAPSTVVHGVRVHSGDILLSRGAAPTSALIARGNDFPGNFSHVALAHVDDAGKASLVEAHIEEGVTVASPEEYLRDRKLRVMVLRLRADLPAIVADPALPHQAASDALHDATSRHIPYDFSMDFQDHARLFCSEVASAAYARHGVTLWMGLSTLSSPGLCAWLASFGVEHFVTQEPSDLEYDPQLVVVAEWRDAKDLLLDHADNAVIDAMLEGAERGQRVDYSLPMLPIARLMKGYSAALNAFGGVGPIPEGMSATAALRSEAFRKRHEAACARLMERVERFRASKGYTPPYWELLRLARESQPQ